MEELAAIQLEKGLAKIGKPVLDNQRKAIKLYISIVCVKSTVKVSVKDERFP